MCARSLAAPGHGPAALLFLVAGRTLFRRLRLRGRCRREDACALGGGLALALLLRGALQGLLLAVLDAVEGHVAGGGRRPRLFLCVALVAAAEGVGRLLGGGLAHLFLRLLLEGVPLALELVLDLLHGVKRVAGFAVGHLAETRHGGLLGSTVKCGLRSVGALI